MDYLKSLSGNIDIEFLSTLKTPWDKGYGPQYTRILNQLPDVATEVKINQGVVELIGDAPDLEGPLRELISWRKGPFKVFNHYIDTEWRSDFKWNRLEKAIPSLTNNVILDIGANNGYFMFRMGEQNPELVLGIEPTLIYKTQFEFINHFVKAANLKMETWGVEHLHAFENVFDVIFSMGILYHHRSPLQQLFDMRMAMKSGGTLILETIGIPGEDEIAITPEDRYAGMRNIWLLPTLPMLIRWLDRSKFTNIEVISTEWGEANEQRATNWSGEVSFEDFLTTENKNLTKEGLPAPKRFLLKASKK